MSQQQEVHTEEIDVSTINKLSLTDGIGVLLGAALLILVAVNVFCRYVLNIGITWSDEVARLLFVWIVFIGAFISYKRNSHAALNVLGNKLPLKIRRYYRLILAGLEIVFMFVLTWFGTVHVLNTDKFGQVTAGLGVPMSWFYLVIPITGLMMMLHLLISAIRAFKNKGGAA